jgi:hypothetical protein
MSSAVRSGCAKKLGRFIAAVTVALCFGTTSTAHAAPSGVFEPMRDVAETGQPGLLSLTSSVLPLKIPWLGPGDTFSWQIGLRLTEQPVANGTLEFIPYGRLVQPGTGYRLTAQRCETQWAGQSGSNAELSCAPGAKILLADALLEAGPTARIPFGDVAGSTSPHILFTLALPEGSAASGSFSFALGFTVVGDEAAMDDSLPHTGLTGVGALGAAGALLGAGLLIRLAGSRRAGKSCSRS